MKAHLKHALRQDRTLVMAVLVIAVIWGVSFLFQVSAGYGNDSAVWVIGSAPGELWLIRWWAFSGVSVNDGFHFDLRPPDPELAALKTLSGIDALGFFVHHSARGAANAMGTIVVIPFWAIAVLILATMAWFRYRRSRRPPRGFDPEVK